MQQAIVPTIASTYFTQPKPKIYYPESDGAPVGETDFHVSVIFYLRAALRQYFRQAAQVYVAANMFFYYEKGDPSAVTAPDVFVVKGVEKYDRRTYKLWEEKHSPCVIFEITSRSTRLEDLGNKRALYEMLGVEEYFLFDPFGEYLTPQLQGFRLDKEYYRPIPLSRDNSLMSQELGLILKPVDSLLRLIDPNNQEMLLTLGEATRRAQTEAQRAQTEAQRADQAETEIARLQAELAKLRGQSKRR